MKTLFAIFGIVAIGFLSIAQTNNGEKVQVLSTNYLSAVDWYRDVNGQLYNTQQSALWKNLEGKCLSISTNGIVISILEPIYGRMDQLPSWTEGSQYMGLNPSQQVRLGERETGKVIFLTNYPTALMPAVTKNISFRAIQTGTISQNGEVLELWDYGTQHKVPVVVTNRIKAANSKITDKNE
jgi:hypothetical protein